MDRKESPRRTAPANAKAWRAYRRLLGLTLAVALGLTVVAIGWLRLAGAPMSAHLVAAVSIAVVATLMLSAALMGLMFASHRLGADARAAGERPRLRE